MSTIANDLPPKTADANLSPFLDISQPNIARIFNFLLGGSTHFEVDRQAANQLLTTLPMLGKWVRLRRAFALEAAHILHQQGFRQFLDLGSGMPTDEHLHSFLPDSRIIYSDINPIAVSYGNSLFANLENVSYIHGNAANVQTILQASPVQRLINPQQKVAIGLNFITTFLSEKESQKLAQTLYQWAPANSVIFVLLQSLETNSPHYEQFQTILHQVRLPLHFYTQQQSIDMLKPWAVSQLLPITDFLGLPAHLASESNPANFGFTFQAAFFEKKGI